MYLVLPGFSLKNKEEAEAIALAIESKNQKVYLHKWRHWDNPEAEFDPWLEVDLIKKQIEGGDLNIVAKSIGTYIAVNLLKEVPVNKLTLMGIPVSDLTAEELTSYSALSNLEHFTVIHNDKDPHGNIQQVEDLLSGLEYDLILKEAAHHEYRYVEDILKALGLN